jgi:hypothetical protein
MDYLAVAEERWVCLADEGQGPAAKGIDVGDAVSVRLGVDV